MAFPSEVHSDISTKRELQFLQKMTDTKLLMAPPLFFLSIGEC